MTTCHLCGLDMRGCTLRSHLKGHEQGGWTHQQEIIDKYNEGWTFDRITHRYHVGKKLIAKMLNDHGIPIRPSYTHAAEHLYTCPHCERTMRGAVYAKHLRSHEEAGWETEQDIVDLYEYKSVAWICQKLHMSRTTVIEILTRHGQEVYVEGSTKGREHFQPCVICGYLVRGCTLARHMQSHREGGWRNIQEIADLYHQGMSLRMLGERFHTGSEQIRNMLVSHGVSIRSGSMNQHIIPLLTEEARERIFEMYDSGFSIFKVAQNLHLSKHMVRKTLLERHAEVVFEQAAQEPTPARRVLYYLKALESDPIRPGTSYTTERLAQDEIARTVYLYRDRELTMREVGKILGIRGHTVHWRLHRAGVPTRSRKENYALLRRRKMEAARSTEN